jgi:hypothetical protein
VLLVPDIESGIDLLNSRWSPLERVKKNDERLHTYCRVLNQKQTSTDVTTMTYEPTVLRGALGNIRVDSCHSTCDSGLYQRVGLVAGPCRSVAAGHVEATRTSCVSCQSPRKS